MCVDPATAALISLGVTAVGTGVAAYSSYSSGQASQRAAEYRAKQAERQARDATERAAVEEQRTRRQTAQLEGRQRALMAAGNVDLGSGSPLLILADTAQFGEMDAQTVRNNGVREKRYYEEEARLGRMGGAEAANAGMLNAFGTVVQGFGTVADKWYKPSYGKQAKPYGNW